MMMVVRPSGALLGPEASRGLLGASASRLGGHFGRLGGLFGCLRALLRPSWGHLGLLLGLYWAILGLS